MHQVSYRVISQLIELIMNCITDSDLKSFGMLVG